MSANDSPRHVVLGVGGGIAAYKAVELLRLLRESGLVVTVVPTNAALKFVGEPTWTALAGHPVTADVFENVADVPHVRIGQQADVVIVAPATADLLARAAGGHADDLLTNTLLTARCPVIMAPAMHTEMWEHPATKANVATLRDRGIIVIDPDSGRLTGADSGPGRLPDPQRLADAVHDVLRRAPARDLAGLRVVISAGGTREAWDPVRFIGNASSGRQGVELARTALARGANVTLVAAAMEVIPPAGATVVRALSARELADAMTRASTDADVIVMAAAVADFRPADEQANKVKRAEAGGTVDLKLVQNPDILRGLVDQRNDQCSKPGQVIVGFAAETAGSPAALADLANAKLARKGCDLLVANDVSGGAVFGDTDNAVLILGANGSATSVAKASKAAVADAIWDAVLAERATR